MALSLVEEFSFTPVTGIQQVGSGVYDGIFVAVFDFSAMPGCSVEVSTSILAWPGAVPQSVVWSSGPITTAAGTFGDVTDYPEGVLTPPIPVLASQDGTFRLELISGSPAGAVNGSIVRIG